MPALVRRRTEGLSAEQWRWRPAPRANPVGFLLWHALRIYDMQLGRMQGVPSDQEVWHTAGFRQRTGYDPRGLGSNGSGTGTGYSTAMVDQVPVDRELVLDYVDALRRETVAFFGSLSPVDLERPVASPTGNPATVAQAVELALRHLYQHLGEADYVRGLMGIPDPTMPREE